MCDILRRMGLKHIATTAVLAYLAQTSSVPAPNPQPWTRHVIDASSRGADGVRAADANGDGVTDLVAGWEQGGITRVYLATRGSDDGPRWRAITVGKTPDVEDAVLFDADGDGALDVICSTEGNSRNILVHWAPPLQRYTNENAWRTETLFSDGSQWMFAVPMDVDRRGGLDLIVGGKNERAAVGWLESPMLPRNIREWKFHRLSDAGWIMTLMVRDMNRDGRPDILLSDRRGALAGVRWLEHPGSDSPGLAGPWRNHWIGARGREAMLLDAADMDGDGVAEIVVPHYDLDIINTEEHDNAARGNPGLGVVWYENPTRARSRRRL